MARISKRGITRPQGQALFGTGILLSALGLALSLYSIPDSADPRLPVFPFLELRFPLIPLFLVISAVLLSAGWVAWRGSLVPLLVLASALFAFGIILSTLSILYPIPENVQGRTLFIFPYSAQSTEPFLTGALITVFGIIFSGARGQKPRGQEAQSS